MNGQLEGHKRWTVPLSLALSFLANDGEELLTIVPSLPETLDRVSERTAGRVPIPGLLRDIDQTHINVGVAMMGALCAAAVADGVRSRGRGALYQDFQWVFGLHGLSHIGASLVTKGYTTGVLSSPTVVLPQFAYVMRALVLAQVPHRFHPVRAISRVAGWLAVSHLTGYIVSRGRRTAR